MNTNNLNRETDGNCPFFVDNYNSGTTTFTNPDGFYESVLPGTSNSTTVVNLLQPASFASILLGLIICVSYWHQKA